MTELTKREREQIERADFIITKAEKLFSKNGVEKVSMDDVAREAEFTKRTIYRYFTCKEDLIFAILLKGNERLLELIKGKCQQGANGFEKARLSSYAYYEYYCRHPYIAQLANIKGYIKAPSSAAIMPYQKKFMDSDRILFKELVGLFEEGKADGSIRSDFDISKLALTSVFLTVGFFQLFSQSGANFTKHFGLDKEDFVKSTIELLSEMLRTK